MPEPADVRFIYRDEQYHDVAGRMILERQPVQGMPPQDFCRFRSIGTLEARLPDGRVMKRDFIVPIPGAATVAQAFEQVDDAVQRCKGDEIARFDAEINKARLALPSAMQTNRIIRGPNGGPRKF